MDDLDAASLLPAMADPGSSSSLDVEKGPDPASLKAAMQVPITVMLGPTGPLLRKLGSLAASDLPSADEIRLLKVLCISLKDLSEDEGASFMVQWWMKIVRELCYDADDLLEEVIDGGRAHHDFSALLARAKYAYERRNCFQWSPPPKVNKPAELGEALRLPAPICDRSSKVGVPEQLVQLLALDDEEKALKVIPIHGCAGVGKTTVARTLYHKHGGKFQCRAFITASTNPYMRELLTSLLSQLKAPRPHGFADVPDLINAINKHLQGKRYFIVIDDLWTASVWNIVGRAFPRGDSCSRIITTTQIDDVALECCGYYPVYMYKMEPLNDYDESRKLFFGTVFGSEDACPTNIKEVSYDIIRKCGGLPLAIANIARLLASEPNIIKWKHIQDSLPSTFEGMKAVVNLMYNSLPPRLRTCLLYLSMYAQGYLIKKNVLVKLWVAEDFLSPVGGEDTQEIAESYFDELVSRGMVQAVDTDNNGKVLSCSVHQIVLDFIRHKSREENLVITVDYNQSTLALPEKVRRLSVQFGGVKSAYIPESIVTSHVRSLIFWGFFKSLPSSFMDYGLLRILILHIWADEHNESLDLTGIGELFLLKYLDIECNITVNLPDTNKIRWVQHLETLQVDARLSPVPSDIVLLERLLHLRLPSEYILPSLVAHMSSLRTLGYFDIGCHSEDNVLHLGRLTNLQDLKLTCSRVRQAEKQEKNVQILGLIIEKLKVLQSITLVPAASGTSCVNIPSDGFSMASPPPNLLLRRIELSQRCCIFFSLPKWFGELKKLCILKIGIRRLSWNDTDMLKGLPALTALTMYIQTAPADRIVIDKGGFQELKYFKFMCSAPCLSFVQGAMQKVQELELGFNSNKGRSHTFEAIGFRNLTCLTDVTVQLGVQDAEEVNLNDAESGLKDAVRCYPNSPTIKVQIVDVISYGEEKLQDIRDDKIKKCEPSEEKQHEIKGGKKKRERSKEERHETEGGKKKRERSEEKRHEIEADKKKMERSEEDVNKQLLNDRYARTSYVFSPLNHHAQEVDVVMGAMGSLLPKLFNLLKDEYNLEAEVKDSVESLHNELEGMQATLQEVAKLEPAQLNVETRIWAREVRDLSYDTEDTIDSLPVHVEGSQGHNKGLITWVAEFLSGENSRQGISDAINVIMKRARYLATRPERYMVRVQLAANPNAAANFEHHRLFALYNDQKEIVGINVSRDEVIRKLRTHDRMFNQMKIVSIVGMGGLGKSTLAKAVYDNIQEEYHCKAFVTVSKCPDRRKVYIDILFQINKQKYMNLNLAIFDERQLIDEVRGLLAGKRYLIVFDDIWDVNSLEVMKFALIDSGVGSRVVTTTRILEVAVNADDVFRLKALSDSHSEELFNTRLVGGIWKNNRLFDGKDNIPSVVPKVPEKLLQKCGGVPLAIIMMASLLDRTPRDVWSKVNNNIGFGYEVGGNTYVDRARKILLSSYYDLPCHLRSCLLHLHIFPENCLIRKKTLIWKWAAEGLIVGKPGRGLFELGEEYLKELINRNVVMPVEDDSHCGKVIGCRVHYLVFEMICSLSTEENFVTVLDGNEQYFLVESKARRLAVQKWATEQGDPLAKIIRPGRLRSLYTMRCHFRVQLSLSRFKFLRVIAIEQCTFSEDNLKHLGKLRLLRYLGLYGTPIVKLPEEIGDLIYLQTLDLMGTGVRELPRGVARLRQLKCLRTDKSIKVPDWIGNLTSLEELQVGVFNMWGDIVTELGKLTELRELEMWISEYFCERGFETLVESMRKLEKIQVLRLMKGNRSSNSNRLNFGAFDPPGQLHELYLSIPSFALPAWINVSRVPILSHLYVNVDAVTEQDLENLGSLPELISLDLVLPSDAVLTINGCSDSRGQQTVSNERKMGAFTRLRYFGTSAVVRFLPGAMPRLEFIRFEINNQNLEHGNVNFYDDSVASTLGNLPSLQKVQLEISSTDDPDAMHEAVKRAVDKHPNHASLNVIKLDEGEDTDQGPFYLYDLMHLKGNSGFIPPQFVQMVDD